MTDSEIKQLIEDSISEEIEGLRAHLQRELADLERDLRTEIDELERRLEA